MLRPLSEPHDMMTCQWTEECRRFDYLICPDICDIPAVYLDMDLLESNQERFQDVSKGCPLDWSLVSGKTTGGVRE